MAMALPHHMNFLALAIPGAIATIAVFFVGRNPVKHERLTQLQESTAQ
jgi:AAHS family benzoate transporter-like MFS transporter